jgi:prepilin-type N-terminal cleavage/methylation domain-containing protein
MKLKRRARAAAIRMSAPTRGFTLVEVVVTVGLLAIVLALLLVPIMSSLGYFRSATARADAQTAARIAVDAMARELTEAMYVQLDMYDSSMIAFVPPLRVDPGDPNSEIVTPPRPDRSRAVRYWRALHDPTLNHNPQALLGPSNPFFLARTEVPYPLLDDDGWNRWNAAWAMAQDAAGAEGIVNWAPISRVVHKDVDWRFEPGLVGTRNATLQPGYPYLKVQYELSRGDISQTEAARRYRDAVVAMTPHAEDYDVSQLEFNPAVVAGEWLRPVEGPATKDYATYRARYPLWRLGARYTGWAQLSEDPYIDAALRELTWARDPFLLIYRYEPAGGGVWTYNLRALGVFDPRTRTMKIIDPDTRGEIYDTDSHPYRSPVASYAFGIDWIDGSLRCDFPPLADWVSMSNEEPLQFLGSDLVLVPLSSVSRNVYVRALSAYWAGRVAGDALLEFLQPDSAQVRVDTVGDGLPDRTLTQVFCAPRENSDEFQVGLYVPDAPAAGDLDRLQYGWLRLPEYLAGGVSPSACAFFVDFRWRNNGAVPPGFTLEQEKPDLISAYYRTAAVVDIAMTVTRADPSATAGQRVAQSAHITRRVKLRNLLREVRYEE